MAYRKMTPKANCNGTSKTRNRSVINEKLKFGHINTFCYLLTIRKSLAETIFFKSTVTNVLILPIRLSFLFSFLPADLAVESSAFALPFVAFEFAVTFDCVPPSGDVLPSADWASKVSTGTAEGSSSFDPSALKRIRRLCSNTSWVNKPSAQASALVAMKRYHWEQIDIRRGAMKRQRTQNHGLMSAPCPSDSINLSEISTQKNWTDRAHTRESCWVLRGMRNSPILEIWAPSSSRYIPHLWFERID